MPVVQYELDPRGTSADNRVTGEVHTLAPGKKIRAIAPLKGAFFVNTFKVKVVETEQYLTPQMDFVFVEYYETLTIKYNKEIAGVCLITNEHIQGDVQLEYNVLGGEFNASAAAVGDFINSKPEDILSLERWTELNRPSTFIPSPLIHQLGTNYGFEYVNYAIERIRAAVLQSDNTSFDFILNYIKEFVNGVIDLINNEIDVNMRSFLDEYKKKFTKELAGLGNVANLAVSTEDEARFYATKDWKYTNSSDNKYIITRGLMGFKETLYTVFVSSDSTALGSYKGILAVPGYSTLFNMTNGARYIFDTLENVQLSRIPHDLAVYPDPTISDSKWVIHKLVNNVENRHGVFAAYSLKTSEFYTGILSTTVGGLPQISWLKHVTKVTADAYIKKLTDHIDDTNNPHSTLKFHAGLSEVENLPVVTREDIVCRKPVRKYVTYDALLLFWKLFLKDVKTLDDPESEDDEISVAERFRLIFAPCGPCGSMPSVPEAEAPAPVPYVEPRDRLLAVWCVKYDKYGRFSDGFGGSYEKLIEEKSADCRWKGNQDYKERGTLISSYCDGTTLYGKYADGKGSFYIQTIAEDSADCGGISTGNYVLVEIRDAENALHGYGYVTTSLPADSDATVILTDSDGDAICYIFAQPKTLTATGHEATVEIRDVDDSVIGYAIKP